VALGIFTFEFNVPHMHGGLIKSSTVQKRNPRCLVVMLPTVSEIRNRQKARQKALLVADPLHFLAEPEKALLQKLCRPRMVTPA